MAEFKIDGRMTVRKLKENFKNEFEGTLRVYDGRELADDKATLAAIRKGDAKGGEFICRASRTVGKFKQEMKEVFGIRVEVASPDDYVLALDGITLANLKNIKEKATKADMEELVAYKRKSTDNDSATDNDDIDVVEEKKTNESKTISELIEEVDDIRRVVISKFEKRLKELRMIAEEKGVTEFGFKEEPIYNEPDEDDFETEEEYEEACERCNKCEDSRICFNWSGDYQTNVIDGYAFVFSEYGDNVVFTNVAYWAGYDNEPEYYEDGEWEFSPCDNGNWLQCARIIEIIEKELELD